MKRYLIILVTIIGLSFMFSGCGVAKLSPEVQKTFDNSSKMYTTRNMHYNISRGTKLVETTNYQIGILIPVNSEVTMQDVNAKQIVFLYKGLEVVLRNNPRYTGLGISEIAQRYFSAKKVNLANFSKAEQKAIQSGLVKNGMSKKAILVSLGTPPIHQTPTLKMDTWKFWRTRWATFIVTFKNGKVISNP